MAHIIVANFKFVNSSPDEVARLKQAWHPRAGKGLHGAGEQLTSIQLSYSLNSLKVNRRLYRRALYGLLRGDTRSLDYDALGWPGRMSG